MHQGTDIHGLEASVQQQQQQQQQQLTHCRWGGWGEQQQQRLVRSYVPRVRICFGCVSVVYLVVPRLLARGVGDADFKLLEE